MLKLNRLRTEFGLSSTALQWIRSYLSAEICLLIAIFAIGEQKSVLAKQCHMRFVTGDENAKGHGCNSFGILHLKLPWSKWAMCR